MRVRYTLRAQADLQGIFLSLTQRAPAHAQAIRADIRRRIAQLGDFPLMAPMTDEPSVRELTLTRHPYKVYYEIQAGDVWILHVRDARRRPWDRTP